MRHPRDDLGFEDFARSRGTALLRYATVLTADPHTAADVVQAVLEKAFRKWDRVRAADNVDAYVNRMVFNEAVSARRRLTWQVVRDRMPEPPPPPDATDQVDDHGLLIARIRTLPPRQRAALALRYFEDRSDADIAAALGCTESTVRGYIHRALKTLRLEVSVDER